MSVFLSQIDINPQAIGNEDEDDDLEKEDLEREKELRELLDNELDDNDLFDEDGSFTSAHTSMRGSVFEEQGLPSTEKPLLQNETSPSKGALLTSRGMQFLSQVATSGGRQIRNNEQQHHFDDEPSQTLYKNEHMPEDTEAIRFGSSELEKGTERTGFLLNQQEPLHFNECTHRSKEDSFHYHFKGNPSNQVDYSFNSLLQDTGDPNLDHSDYSHHNVSPYNHVDYAQGENDDKEVSYKEPTFGSRASEFQLPRTDFYTDYRAAEYNIKADSMPDKSRSSLDLSEIEHDVHGQKRPSSNYNTDTSYGSVNGVAGKTHRASYGHSYQHKEAVDHALIDQNADPYRGQVREVTQMRILYDARGRKIEELKKVIEENDERLNKEIRILKHRLALVTGERDGLNVSLEQSQQLVNETRREISDLKSLLTEEQAKVQRLKNEREELIEKLQLSQSTIESLNNQITELSHMDSLSKLRAQHETLLATLRQKHEDEVLRLKEKLDETKNNLAWKIEDVTRLHDELLEVKRSSGKSKVESAETINRLTKSLEESQKRCRDLLETGSVNEFGEVKFQLKQTLTQKAESEKKLKDLQTQVSDLKEQLHMYEAALDSQNMGPTSSTPFNPLAAKLGINRFEQDSLRTPTGRIRIDTSTQQTESPIYSLREELIKALANNRAKREEIAELKKEVERLNKNFDSSESGKRKLEIDNKTLKDSLKLLEEQNINNTNEAETDLEDARKEIERLTSVLQTCESKLQETEEDLKNMKEDNQKFKSQMAELVREFDQDKLASIDNCQNAYMQLVDESKRKFKEQVKEQHEEELQHLREQIKTISNELLDVKDAYVKLSEQNRTIEQHVREECLQEAEERIKEIQLSMEQEHKESLQKCTEELSNKHLLELEVERKTWRNKQQEEIEHKIETAVALAKVDWFKEHEDRRSSPAEETADTDFEVNLKQLRESWEKEKEEEYEKRLTTTMLIAKEEWEDKKMVEIEEAVASYKEDLKHRLKEETQREVENAIATAKETWQSDLKKMNDSLNSTLNEVNILKREIEEKENRWKIEEESLNKKIRDTEIFWKRKEEIWRKEKIKAELEKQEENRAWENKVGELEKRLADGQKSSDTQDDANSAIHRLQRELRDAEKRLTDITERNTNEKQELEIELRVLSEEKIALEDVYKRMVEGRDRDIEQAVTVAKKPILADAKVGSYQRSLNYASAVGSKV